MDVNFNSMRSFSLSIENRVFYRQPANMKTFYLHFSIVSQAELLGRTLGAVQQWQGPRHEQIVKVPLHPLAWVHKNGSNNTMLHTHLQLWSNNVLSGDGSSFHAPLHRFLATSIVETSRASVLNPVLEVGCSFYKPCRASS